MLWNYTSLAQPPKQSVCFMCVGGGGGGAGGRILESRSDCFRQGEVRFVMRKPI